MADHETSKLGEAQDQAVAAAEPGPPPGRGPGGALRRRLGIGGGVAIVVAATLRRFGRPRPVGHRGRRRPRSHSTLGLGGGAPTSRGGRHRERDPAPR